VLDQAEVAVVGAAVSFILPQVFIPNKDNPAKQAAKVLWQYLGHDASRPSQLYYFNDQGGNSRPDMYLCVQAWSY
jgi:hypothetical protein